MGHLLHAVAYAVLDEWATKEFLTALKVASNVVKGVFRFLSWGGGLDIVDFWPLPGPSRPRWGLGKAQAGAPLDLHRFIAR